MDNEIFKKKEKQMEDTICFIENTANVGEYQSSKKKMRKDFCGRSKTVSPKINSIPTNSTPASSRTNLAQQHYFKYSSYTNI